MAPAYSAPRMPAGMCGSTTLLDVRSESILMYSNIGRQSRLPTHHRPWRPSICARVVGAKVELLTPCELKQLLLMKTSAEISSRKASSVARLDRAAAPAKTRGAYGYEQSPVLRPPTPTAAPFEAQTLGSLHR